MFKRSEMDQQQWGNVQKMISADMAYCYERAKDCAKQALEVRDKFIRADFLDLEDRWLSLAQQYKCEDGVGECSREANECGIVENSRA